MMYVTMFQIPSTDIPITLNMLDTSISGSDISIEEDIGSNFKSSSSVNDSSDNSSIDADEQDEMETDDQLLSVIHLCNDPCLNVTDHDAVPQYKLVFDNVNKSVKPRFQTIETPAVLLNYVNMYAVKMRTKSFHLSQVSLNPPADLTKEAIARNILSSIEDDCQLKINFSMLVSRILVQYIPFLSMFQ